MASVWFAALRVCRDLGVDILPVGILVLVGLGTGEEARGRGERGSSRKSEKGGDGELHCCFCDVCLGSKGLVLELCSSWSF